MEISRTLLEKEERKFTMSVYRRLEVNNMLIEFSHIQQSHSKKTIKSNRGRVLANRVKTLQSLTKSRSEISSLTRGTEFTLQVLSET